MLKSILSLLVLTVSNAYFVKYYTNNHLVADYEKDCAFPGTDYIDINTRMSYVLSTSPYSSGISSYSNFMCSYFDNLTYNFGQNYKGSCGYVAMAMLLSYYDTYLSDSIVPEQYDICSYGQGTDMTSRRNSPGILKDVFVNPYNPNDSSYGFSMTASDYYSSISSLSTISLHAYLIGLGASLGYYDYDDNNSPCGTTYSMRYNVLVDYFSNVLNYTLNTDYSFSVCNGESSPSLSDSVRAFAIQQVLSGNPVLLSVSGTYGGHVVVAYDYDSDLDELYCHMGWNASSTHKTVETYSFSRYKTAIVINFADTLHSHSNNYAVTTVINNQTTNNYYCYHDCHISTYTNGNYHDYTDHFATHSSKKHRCYCSCGAYILGQHVVALGSSFMYGGHLSAYCVDCGELVNLETTPVIIEGFTPDENESI